MISLKLHLIAGGGARNKGEEHERLQRMCSEVEGISGTAKRLKEFGKYFGAEGLYARKMRTPALDAARREILGKLAETERDWKTEMTGLEADAARIKIRKLWLTAAGAVAASAITVGTAVLTVINIFSNAEKGVRGNFTLIGHGVAILCLGAAFAVELWHRYFNVRVTIVKAREEIRDVGNALDAIGKYVRGGWAGESEGLERGAD